MRKKEDMSMERCGDGQKHRYPVDQVEEAILMQIEEYEATFSRAQRPVGFKVMFNPWKAR
jgi:hypothetical protein